MIGQSYATEIGVYTPATVAPEVSLLASAWKEVHGARELRRIASVVA
jgi:hypothetical protein